MSTRVSAAAHTHGADLAVVGSGIVGLGAAYAAARRGLRVVVIDRTERIVGATVRNFGHICVGAQTGLPRQHADIARELWLRLARDAGFWLRAAGSVVVARHEDELRLLRAAAGDDLEPLDRAELPRRVPVVDAVGGAVLTADLQVDPREAGAAVAAHLARIGVEFRMRTAVTGVRQGRVETSRGPV